MIKRPVMLDELIRHITSDYVVLEGFRGASLPKILCATDEERVKDGLQSTVFCISGLVSEHLSNYKGVPVINALLNAPDLVDLVERKSLEL
jgi:molybdopterin-guanine dinucleotide biosynthesis protein